MKKFWKSRKVLYGFTITDGSEHDDFSRKYIEHLKEIDGLEIISLTPIGCNNYKYNYDERRAEVITEIKWTIVIKYYKNPKFEFETDYASFLKKYIEDKYNER